MRTVNPGRAGAWLSRISSTSQGGANESIAGEARADANKIAKHVAFA